MWEKKLKKTLFTLNINNYEPELTALTYPLMKRWAAKIGAKFHVIKERKFPKFPVTYEKLQIYELAQKQGNDWNIYIDGDTLVHPDLMDITNYLPKDTVLHNRHDEARHRWRADRFFLRDGRFIGSCNWFAMASDLCVDLWKPLDDLTLEEALASINPIVAEDNGGIKREHLIDDYVLSRNISKHGLKYKDLYEILTDKGYQKPQFLMHVYNMPTEAKIKILKATLVNWGILKDENPQEVIFTFEGEKPQAQMEVEKNV